MPAKPPRLLQRIQQAPMDWLVSRGGVAILSVCVLGACQLVIPPIESERSPDHSSGPPMAAVMTGTQMIIQLAKLHIAEARDALLRADWKSANTAALEALESIGSRHLSASVIDDTGQKLLVAQIEERRGDLEAAARIRLRIAESRLTLLESKAANAMEQNSIGSARMAADGTISLYLRATGPGVVGDSIVEYRPGDLQYDSVRRHLGGIQPGQEKPVPPWP